MRRTNPQVLVTSLACSLLLLGCQTAITPGDEGEDLIAPDGKEDNFFSNTAQEYLASATVEIVLDATFAGKTEAERTERVRRIMEGKTQQIGWFLHLYLIDKGHDAKVSYGGMRAMVLDGSYESDALKADPADPLKYTFRWAVQVGGTKNLLSKIRADKKLGPTDSVFPLDMAKLSNDSVASFSHLAYEAGEWSPASCKCEVETLPVKLEPIPASNDAYLDYAKYLEDGVVDVSIHVGWDYHARYDITHSRELYQWLVGEMGFASPAASYEAYNRLSGPLTKKVMVNGREILMKVTLFHPDPCEAWDEDGPGGAWAQAVEKDKSAKQRSCPNWKWDDPRANANPTTSEGAGNLMADLKESLRTRDAILFSGHSGYTYGYALASWYRTSKGDLDPPEIKTLDLPRDKSQLFVFSGCDTYHVAEAFRENPNKLGLVNADVITTTSFSDAGDVSDTQNMVRALVGEESGYTAYSYGRLMGDLNRSILDAGWGYFTMYGIHGLDDNPRANPLGDASKTCSPCESAADCGGAVGNVCVRLNGNEKVCAVECLHDQGCTEDQACRAFGSSTTRYLRGMACVPKTSSCNVAPPPPTEKAFTASGDLARGESQSYSVRVGSAARNITVAMTGTGDADLYTGLTAPPTLKEFACRPYKSTSSETCSHRQAANETLEIMVSGFGPSSHFEIKVTWD
jgi:hypothetical protein